MADKKKQAAHNVRRIRDLRAKVMMLEEKVKTLERANLILEANVQDCNDVFELTISSDDGVECLMEWIETGVWPQ